MGLNIRSSVPLTPLFPSVLQGCPEVDVVQEKLADSCEQSPGWSWSETDRFVTLRWNHEAARINHAATRIAFSIELKEVNVTTALLRPALTVAAIGHDYLPIHGGLTRWKQDAFALVGPSGSGKSTLVYELSRLGLSTMSEDVAICQMGLRGVEAFSSYPSIRLGRKQQSSSWEVLPHNQTKVVSADVPFSSGRGALAAFVFLRFTTGTECTILELPRPLRIPCLHENLYLGPILKKLKGERIVLNRVAEVAGATPCFAFTRPFSMPPAESAEVLSSWICKFVK